MFERKGNHMLSKGIVLVASYGALAFGCTPQPDETQEIIANLVEAGFPADDIVVNDDVVYVGRDAVVTLAASREMLRSDGSSKEQYRTTNTVSPSLAKICIDGTTFTEEFSTALNRAIENFNDQPLSFAMARTPSTDCSFTINAVIQPGLVGGSAGFPEGGLPYSTIIIGGGLVSYSIDTIEHVITHEIGHTIGFRHSDYFNRSISCGIGGNEGDAGIGAIHIPGTPTGAVVGGSIMNSCFRTEETGEFTSSDVTAIRALYTPTQNGWRWCHKCQGLFYGGHPGAVCPAGGAHNGSVSLDYALIHRTGTDPGLQDNWRWCHKCQGLFYGGHPGAVCPAGGAHNGSISFNYTLIHGTGSGPGLQDNWRWCHKCQGLVYGGHPTAVCPAGGTHAVGVSFNYGLLHL